MRHSTSAGEPKNKRGRR